MKIILLTFATILFAQCSFAQNDDSLFIGDLHAHITNKHFITDVRNAATVRTYWEQNHRLPSQYLKNWEVFPAGNFQIDPLEDSHYKNYFQATYGDLQKGNFKITVQAISPVEPNLFHLSRYFSKAIRKLGVRTSHINEMDFLNLINTPSWTEAYNELLYTVHQDPNSPDGNYRMLFPKNRAELNSFILQNNTGIGLLSFEGGHVLFADGIFRNKEFFYDTLSDFGKNEVSQRIDSLKNFEYRIFFITPIHIYWNTLGGFAKAIDKLQSRQLLTRVTKMNWVGRFLFFKKGSGLPPQLNSGKKGYDKHDIPKADCECKKKKRVRVDNACFSNAPGSSNFGREVIFNLLTPGPHGKPIYIDVKHMDVRSRLDYYILHDSLEIAWDTKIPIIYSHGAVSGEKLKVAHYTSVAPMMDRYPEINDPRAFYIDKFIRNGPWYNCGLKDYVDKYKSDDPLLFGGSEMDDCEIILDDLKLSGRYQDENVVGWFYPWSINLFDEEIEKIYKSDGLIGVMAEERTLGWYLPNYHDNFYKRELKKFLVDRSFITDSDTKKFDSFRVAECFLRNVFYIVKHSGETDQKAWDHIAFGSDFDGLINPLDICQQAGDVPKFKNFLVRAIPLFLRFHPEYHLYGQHDGLLFGLSPQQAMNKLFYSNLRRFVLAYF